MDLLKQYSLVKVQDVEMFVHRLVQESVRTTQREEKHDEDTISKIFHAVLSVLKNNYIDNPHLIHLQTVKKFASKQKHKLLLLKCQEFEGLIAFAHHRFSEAIEIQKDVLEAYEAAGPEVSDVQLASAKCRLARSLAAVRQNTQASKLLKEVTEELESNHGELFAERIDAEYLRGRLELAMYLPQMREMRAMKTLEKVLQLQKMHPQFGNSSPRALLTRLTVGLAYLTADKNDEAERMFQEMSRLRKEQLQNREIDEEEKVSSDQEGFQKKFRRTAVF